MEPIGEHDACHSTGNDGASPSREKSIPGKGWQAEESITWRCSLSWPWSSWLMVPPLINQA